MRTNILTGVMRHTGYTLALLAVVIAAGQLHAGPFTIFQEQPRVHLIDRDDLRIRCRSNKDIGGCAEFLGEALQCHCERRDDAWRIAATARFIPYVYVTTTQLVAHEQSHIDDIKSQLETFLGELTARPFRTEVACQADADFEAAVFGLRMNVFRTDSNERLH
jgi:hypothetical protein